MRGSPDNDLELKMYELVSLFNNFLYHSVNSCHIRELSRQLVGKLMTDTRSTENARPTSRRQRRHNPEATRANIISVATQEFAENGLSGARIDEIAAKTATSKRMIYYYFGDKAGLYRHVLEAAYARVRAGEEALQLDHLDPVDALRRLAGAEGRSGRPAESGGGGA